MRVVACYSAPGSGLAEGPRKLKQTVFEIASLDASLVLSELATSIDGLDDNVATERLEQHGLNIITHERRVTALRLLFQRFYNPLILLLFLLASVSVFIGDAEAAILMLIMIFLGVGLGTFQEWRSSAAEAELEALVMTSATVQRKRGKHEISQKFLVPGDIVILSAGDLVPGDVRLISSKDLSVDQAPLTGEALPVDKHATPDVATGNSPFELQNICFMGSSVVSGTAVAVVLATGHDTHFGKLAKTIAGQHVLTSFERGINQFTWLMIRFMFLMVPLVFLINGALRGDWFEALLFSVSIAVGLTPEMLPMIVTVNLAKGAIVMSKRNVIVKRLSAIQNFGGMDVLCADKTGTITQNKVILERHINVLGNETPAVLRYAYLNSFHQTGLRNLLDIAVLKHGKQDHLRKIETEFDKIDEIPFDFIRKRMSVVLRDKLTGTHLLVCKGAVDEVYNVSSSGRVDNEVFPLDESHRGVQRDLARRLNADGFRILAVAYKEMPPLRCQYSARDESGLTLIGYLAFLDPPKETAQEAIAALKTAGVNVKILTGDNEVVSHKVCKEVGLVVDRVLLGPEIETMPDDQLAEIAETTSVFARLTPSQKARIIQCLHRKEHVVGYLGDGINDGPALRAADVGISVDSAVDVAKESADIILLQKNLLILREGVIEGRRVFSNIIKYIRMAASSNFGNMLSMLGASAFLPFLPMQPIQVLTNNLLYDISQTTIPTDNVDTEFLLKPQRWRVSALRRFILLLGPVSSIFDYATFFIMLHVFGARTHPTLFQTGWFVESLATQTLIIHVIRTSKIPFIQSRPSLPLILTSTAIIALGIWLPSSPLGRALKLTTLPPLYWPVLACTLFLYVAFTQVIKAVLVRRHEFE